MLQAAPAADADKRHGAALPCLVLFHQKGLKCSWTDQARTQLDTNRSVYSALFQQAFLNKHFKGCNARWFAPERIRELAPSERGERGAATFVSLEGLGRIPFSNIRRPKPLMDVGAGPGEQVRRLCRTQGTR